jgi:hypothetical protein
LTFSIATLDELWSHGRLVERRLSHGRAVEDEHGILATDARDDALVALTEAEMARLRKHVLPDARVRLIAEATAEGVTGTMTVRVGERSIVTTPEFLVEDLRLIGQIGRMGPIGPMSPIGPIGPILWRHGSAAVLLHEAFGHPREHGHHDIEWPSWLTIDAPLAMRRATFRDVPLLRMTTLTARQHGAPFALPERRIEVLLVDGGAYEPLTETVTLRIGAANLIEGDEVRGLAPFELVRTRTEIAGSIIGATGEPVRYPGVVCSREGQELVVGSYAPVMVTR